MAKHAKSDTSEQAVQNSQAAPEEEQLKEGEPGPDALESLEPEDAPPLLFDEGEAMPEEPAGKHGKPGDVPEYQHKSRRMRKILIIVLVLLVVLIAVLGFFTFTLIQESQTRAAQQAQSQQNVDDERAIQEGETTDAVQSSKKTDVPDLVSLLGMTQDQAIESLAHGATVSATRAVNEEGNAVKSQATVTLTEEPADTRTGTPTVYLFFDEGGTIIRTGYSTGTSSLGYGSLSFADAVENEHIVEKTLAEAGLPVEEGTVTLPADKAAYSTYATDGTTLTRESCTFSGTAAAGANYAWESVLLYDYTTANTTGNLADTIRQIYVYIGAA